jgi:hypothetical protein
MALESPQQPEARQAVGCPEMHIVLQIGYSAQIQFAKHFRVSQWK